MVMDCYENVTSKSCLDPGYGIQIVISILEENQVYETETKTCFVTDDPTWPAFIGGKELDLMAI